MPSIFVNDGAGNWKKPKNIMVNNGSAWVKVKKVFINVDNTVWKPAWSGESTVDISSNTYNYNLAAALGNPNAPLTVTVNIAPNVLVLSNNTAVPAFDVGALPAGSVVNLNIGNFAYIAGCGGSGEIPQHALYLERKNASGYWNDGVMKHIFPSATPAQSGGPALRNSPGVTMNINNQGIIGGGGGGSVSGCMNELNVGDVKDTFRSTVWDFGPRARPDQPLGTTGFPNVGLIRLNSPILATDFLSDRVLYGTIFGSIPPDATTAYSATMNKSIGTIYCGSSGANCPKGGDSVEEYQNKIITVTTNIDGAANVTARGRYIGMRRRPSPGDVALSVQKGGAAWRNPSGWYTSFGSPYTGWGSTGVPNILAARSVNTNIAWGTTGTLAGPGPTLTFTMIDNYPGTAKQTKSGEGEYGDNWLTSNASDGVGDYTERGGDLGEQGFCPIVCLVVTPWKTKVINKNGNGSDPEGPTSFVFEKNIRWIPASNPGASIIANGGTVNITPTPVQTNGPGSVLGPRQ